MSWLTNFIRPKIRSLVEQKEVPDNLWQKCPACEGMLFHRDLAEQLNVSPPHCGYHMKINVQERLALLFDDGRFRQNMSPGKVPFDPLKFKDRKKYADRLKDLPRRDRQRRRHHHRPRHDGRHWHGRRRVRFQFHGRLLDGRRRRRRHRHGRASWP